MGKLRALIIYWSATGNTEKVARRIHHALAADEAAVDLFTVAEADDVELYDYDLLILGAPSYMWSPPDPMRDFLKRKMRLHDDRGDIKLAAPKIPGKKAAVFCTYSGPHTGLREAIPVGKYLGQFCEHLGFDVIGEWYVVGEFHGREDRSTQGYLGDIRGRPNEDDLRQVDTDVAALLQAIRTAG
jgi:flavodoxin